MDCSLPYAVLRHRPAMDPSGTEAEKVVKFYIERRDGMIRVRQKVNVRLRDDELFRTRKEVKDTRENYKDILRWADIMGHTIEEMRPGDKR